MPDKFLAGRITVEAKSFVQAPRLSPGKSARGEFRDSSPKVAGQLGIINDHAAIIASVGLYPVTSKACDGGLFKAVSFCPPDKRVTFRGSEESLDCKNSRSKLVGVHCRVATANSLFHNLGKRGPKSKWLLIPRLETDLNEWVVAGRFQRSNEGALTGSSNSHCGCGEWTIAALRQAAYNQASPHMTVTCPECQSPSHSRKTKICGQCGAVLPWIEREIEAEKHEEERRWARELAEKVTSTAFNVTGSRTDRKSNGAGAPRNASSLPPEKLLERVSYAEAFRTRTRPYFGIVAAAYAFSLGAFGWALSMDALTLLALGGVAGVIFHLQWRCASPFCPQCRQDIRTCLAEHCHVCGGPLTRRQCARCEVDHTWTGWFRRDRGGRLRSIVYCPGCGVQLDTRISRRGRS